MEEIEVVKFCKKTHNPLSKKNMKLSDWLQISKNIYVNFYFKAYKLGYSQFKNLNAIWKKKEDL